MVKVTIDIEADAIVEAATDILAQVGERIVVVGGKAVAVLPPATAGGVRNALSTRFDPEIVPSVKPHALAVGGLRSYPTDDEVHLILSQKPRTTRDLNRYFGYGTEQRQARTHVKNRVQALLRDGRVKPQSDGRFPIYEAVSA